MRRRLRGREPAAAIVLLLLGKNAAGSIVANDFGGNPPLVLGWYALCALQLSLALGPRPPWLRLGRGGEAFAAGLGGVLCLWLAVQGWPFGPAAAGESGPVAAWYDFVQLALAYAWVAVCPPTLGGAAMGDAGRSEGAGHG